MADNDLMRRLREVAQWIDDTDMYGRNEEASARVREAATALERHAVPREPVALLQEMVTTCSALADDAKHKWGDPHTLRHALQAINAAETYLDAVVPANPRPEPDTVRLDWLQQVKEARFKALNFDHKITAIGLFTVPSQHVRGNTVREAIDKAMDQAGVSGGKAESEQQQHSED